jgi:hypothetical protein
MCHRLLTLEISEGKDEILEENFIEYKRLKFDGKGIVTGIQMEKCMPESGLVGAGCKKPTR